jgi:hypothetical protein
MYIPIYRLAWYTDALEKAESPKSPVLPSGKVLIGVRARFQLYDWYSSSVNISSLLRAYKKYSDWKLEFDFPKYHPQDPLAKLFSVRVNEKWWNRLQTQVKEVSIWLHEDTKAHIIVRYGELWMLSQKKGKKAELRTQRTSRGKDTHVSVSQLLQLLLSVHHIHFSLPASNKQCFTTFISPPQTPLSPASQTSPPPPRKQPTNTASPFLFPPLSS